MSVSILGSTSVTRGDGVAVNKQSSVAGQFQNTELGHPFIKVSCELQKHTPKCSKMS